MDALALEVRGLTRRFGTRTAVDGLDLSVALGDVYGFLGPNGAGKTTAMRCILGLLPANAGTVKILGQDDLMAARRHIGAVVEIPAFHGWMSGRANLQQAAWYAGLTGKAATDEIDRVLARVGLAERARDLTIGYSLGMRQRLGIARALLAGPRMLFLDEPTNGLDPAGMREMRELVRSLALHDQITVFVSSHLLGEVQSMCNRVAIVQNGQLRAEGAVTELLASVGDPVYRLAADDTPALEAALGRLEGVDVLGTADDGMLRARSARPASELNAWLHLEGVPLSALVPEKRNLEDVFLEAVR